jgi:subtilisin family serine protease
MVERKSEKIGHWLGGGLAFSCLFLSAVVSANPGSRDDPVDRAIDRAAERSARNETRAVRDDVKFREDRAKIEARVIEERASAATRSPAEQAKVEARESEAFAKVQADAAEEAAKREADAQKDAADLAEDIAKAAEDAAKDTESSSGHGSSGHGDGMASMRNLASSENPEFDRDGFPAKRGEIVALDLARPALEQARARGFSVLSETSLPLLGTTITHMNVPSGMAANDALDLMRTIDSNGRFDLAHYYGLNVGLSGTQNKPVQTQLVRHKGNFKVGMIDTAIAAHPSLAGMAIDARDFSSGNGSAPTQHGTAIASILSSEGSARIVAANVFKNNQGQTFTSSDAIVRALEWMIASDVTVINISLAGPRNTILDTLIQRASARGFVIVAAAGNGGPNAAPAYPAAVPSVVAVTAVDASNRIYRYANQGNYIAVAARGVGVTAASPDGKVSGFTGTSFATPHITAVIARCVERLGKRAGAGCVAEMERSARDLGKPGRDAVYGFGLVN